MTWPHAWLSPVMVAHGSGLVAVTVPTWDLLQIPSDVVLIAAGKDDGKPSKSQSKKEDEVLQGMLPWFVGPGGLQCNTHWHDCSTMLIVRPCHLGAQEGRNCCQEGGDEEAA